MTNNTLAGRAVPLSEQCYTQVDRGRAQIERQTTLKCTWGYWELEICAFFFVLLQAVLKCWGENSLGPAQKLYFNFPVLHLGLLINQGRIG